MMYTQALLIAAAALALGFWAGWQLGKIRGWGDAQEDAKTAEIAMQQHKVAEELLQQAKEKEAEIIWPQPEPKPTAKQVWERMILELEKTARTGTICDLCAHNGGDVNKEVPCRRCTAGGFHSEFLSKFRSWGEP